MPTDLLSAPEILALASSDDRVDVICDAFEGSWIRGETPDLATFLCHGAAADRAALFSELLALDLEYRQRHGELPTKAAYLARFPEFAEQLESIAFVVGWNDGAAVPANGECQDIRRNGRRIGPFLLLELLGAGAAGEVWKARDLKLQRTAAIKIPHTHGLTEEVLHRFLREGRAAAQLRHPNIVSIYDAGRDGDAVYLVADFIDGPNLCQWLSSRRIPSHRAGELCATLAEALHHAHERGIVHRDLKPANIILDRDEQPHITDFGLAKWADDSRGMTLQGQLLGTPAYMSPEQARGDVSKVDRRADVYALGALLYEMLIGRTPFEGDVATVIHQVLHDEPPAPRQICSSVPRDLETICLRAMAKERGRRYPSAQEMAVDLRRFLRGDAILARRVGRIEKSWRWLRRRPAVAASISLTVCVAVAGGAIISLREQNYQIQGYRSVQIDTSPSGARLAIVPIDRRTGEPMSDSEAIILPGGLTPLQLQLKPGNYLIEAVLRNGKQPPDFAEVYRTIAPLDVFPAKRAPFHDAVDKGPLVQIGIRVHRFEEVTAEMIRVPIGEELRRRNLLLPDVIYIDPQETRPDDMPAANNDPATISEEGVGSERYILFADAKLLAEGHGKRLLSAVEYDAILRSTLEAEPGGSIGRRDLPPDLSGGLPEWTTTTFDYAGVGASSAIAWLRNMHMLGGYGDPSRFPGMLRSADGQLISSPNAESRTIGFRGAHSGAPRFVKP